MENLEMVLFDENGQGTINFESLEMITSLEFVMALKRDIKKNDEVFVKVYQDVKGCADFVDVVIKDRGVVTIYNYSFYRKVWDVVSVDISFLKGVL